MKIFVFQTRRIGDFFQSVPLIETLKQLCSKNADELEKIDILIDESIFGIRSIFNEKINFKEDKFYYGCNFKIRKYKR